MNNRDLVFALKFQTTNSAAINKAAKEINKAAAAAKKVEQEGKKATAALTRFGIAARKAGQRMVRFSREARAAFSRMRTGALRLTAALGAIGFAVGFTTAINVAKEFEFQMARLSAISGQLGRETNEQFRALEGIARRLGATTQFTAGQVANGLRLLAQAGFSAQEAIAAIPGTLNLAIAATTDLGTATTITANTIRGFNLEASEAGKIADILTATTQGSNTTIEALGEALKFVAPAAASANQSIEVMSAAIGTLSDAGLKGTLAGTGLRRVIVGLLNPTKAARDAFGRLGLTTEELDPRLRSLEEIMTDLNTAGFGASEAFEAFGLRGGPAALVLSNLLENFKELNGEISESEGVAQAFADRINDTLRGSILRLKSAFEEFLISQGNLAKGFRNMVDTVRQFFEALNGTLNPLEEGAAGVAQFVAGLKAMIPVLIAIAAILTTAAVAVSIMSFGLATVAGAAAAAAVAGGALAVAYATADGEMDQFNITAEQNADVLERIAVAEKAVADAKAAAEAPGATKEDRNKFKLAQGDNLALGDAALAQAQRIQQEIDAINRDLDASVVRRQEILANANKEVNFGLFSLRRGLSGPDANELADIDKRREKLEEVRLEREKELPIFEEAARLRSEALKQIDEENRLRKALATQAINDANEINQILNSESTKRSGQINDLKDELKVLKAELAGGEGGKIAAELEKILQAAGFSGEAATEAGIQSGALLGRLNKQLAEARAGLAEEKAKAAPDQATITAFEAAIKQQEKNLEQVADLTRKTAEQKAEVVQLNEERRVTKKRIDENNKARAEALRIANAQAAAEKSFERFRVNQIAKLQQEINLTKVATSERAKAKAGIELVNRAVAAGVEVNQEMIDSLFETVDALEATKAAQDSFFEGFTQGAKDFFDESATFAENGAELFKNTFKTLEDELVGFVETGKFSFRSLGETIRSTLLRQGVRNILKSTVGAFVGGDEGDSAQAAVVSQLQLLRGTITQTTPTKSQAQTQIQLLTAINNSIASLGGITQGGAIQLPATGGPAGFNFGLPSTPGGGDSIDKIINGAVGGFNNQGGFGGITDNIAQRGGLPRFQNGGITDGEARKAVGIGRSEIPAILHPNEAVIPLTKDGRVPLDIVDGLPQVRLPGNNRSIGTATDSPAKASQVASLTNIGKGSNSGVGLSATDQNNALAFLGAPRFQTGTGGSIFGNDTGFLGIDFGQLFTTISDTIKTLGSTVGNFFSLDKNFFGGLFSGEGALGNVNEFFVKGFDNIFGGDLFGTDDSVGAQGAIEDATRAIEVPTVAQLTPTEQINKGFGEIKDDFQAGIGKAGAFLGLGGESATASNLDKPVSLQDPSGDLQAPTLAAQGTVPEELRGVGNITEGARRQLEKIPAFGRLFKQNDEGTTPFGNIAKGLLPIGFALALQQFGGEAGKKGKSSFTPTGRTIGFNEAGEETELTDEEKELLKQLNQGRKALGGNSGGKGLRSGNAQFGGIPAFGTGGVVSGPTLALVGERTPEAIVPLAGGAIPVRVSGGQQTGKVITNNVNFQIVTPDADSFREAQSQIQASTASSISRAAQRQD